MSEDSFRKFFDEHFIVIPVTVPPKPRTVGVPYAEQGVFEGHLFQQCPACGVRVFEETDADGEKTTNNYGKHYEEEHG